MERRDGGSAFIARQIFNVYLGYMTAWKRIVTRTAVMFACVLTLAYVSLFFLVQSLGVQQWLRAEVARRTGYDANAGGLHLMPPFRMVATAVTVSKSAKPMMQGEQIILTLSPLDVFSRRIHRLELRKPFFYLDAHQLFDASAKTSFEVAIRHLNIEGGTVVLRTAEGGRFDFREITVNAENLNMGKTTGLNLRAGLPWLKGQAEISIRGHAEEKQAMIRIKQNSANTLSRFLTSKSQTADALTAEIKLRKTKSQELEVSASGNLNELSLGGEKVSGQFDVRTDIEPGLKTGTFSGKIDARHLPSHIGAIPLLVPNGAATGTFNGRYSTVDRVLVLKALHFESAAGTADGSGTFRFEPQFTVAQSHVSLRKVPIAALKPLLPESLANISFGGTMEVHAELHGPWPTVSVKGVAKSDAAQFTSEGFSLARLSVKAPFQWANSSMSAHDVHIQGKSLAINRQDQTKISADEISISCGLEKKQNQPLTASGALQVVGGRFATPDGSKVGENLAVTARFETTARRDQGLTTLAGKLDIEQGEILWGKFFGELKTKRPSIDFDGDYAGANDAIQLRRLNLTLGNIGKVDIAGSAERVSKTPAVRVEVKSDELQPAGFFEFFIRETLKRNYPILDQLSVGGRLSFSARAEGSLEDLSVEGQVQVRAGEIGEKSGKWQVGPMELALPFRVHLPAAAAEPAPPKIPTGTLVVKFLRLGSESIPEFRTALSAWNNTVQFPQVLRIPMYGGTLEVRNLAWKDFINDPKAVAFSLDAKNLQLQKLTDALGWHRFGGTLTGSIPKIEYTEHSLRSDGEIQLDIFGGRARIGKVEIENPFSSLPSIKLETRFQGIHLEQASETFAFGRISGILEGSVTDLVVTDGQPSRLMANVYTVERSGAGQWISVEALNNITVLSSGDDGGTIYGGIAAFFDNFRYSKLGFKAMLKNDKLTLRGVETNDGKEFLVVGTFLPPTVNIISHTQEIGFGELLKRLEQMRKSGKPQIK